MAVERKDAVKDQTTTTGTGTVTIALVAPSGARTMAAHTDGATVRYRIQQADLSEWEVGEGVWTSSGATLSRLVVFASSNSNALVNFSAGTKAVWTGPVAKDITATAPLIAMGGKNFNGSTQYLDTNALTGIVDAKVGSIAAVLRFANAASATEIIVNSNTERFRFSRNSTGNITLLGLNAAGSTIMSLTTSGTPCSAAGTYVILVSWDLATAGTARIYVINLANPVESLNVTETTYTNDVIDYTVTEWGVGAGASGASFFSGDMYLLWFDPTQRLEFNTESVRRKFIDANGVPETMLGVHGELVTGTAPGVFLYGPPAQFACNRGTFNTTSFTVNGTVVAATTTLNAHYGGDMNIGQGTAADGTVTQGTSKATGVTLNVLCGDITLNGAALAAGAVVSFVLTNGFLQAGDQLLLNHQSAGTIGPYLLNAACAAGSATIYVRNTSAGSLSEAIVIRFSRGK